MGVKLERKYDFLRKKYNELLWPTFFMVMSEKVCSVIDVIIIGFLLSSTQLSVINMASPLIYTTGMFYILFGQGGNLLALRAQSQLKHEKVNFYFTVSILGIIALSIIYLLLVFIFMDNILMFFNTPAEIFDFTKQYLSIILLYCPLNCFILVISFFIRSDGFPKMPFYAVLIANIINIILDIVFIKVFNMGITGTALASVLGYLVGAIYISQYLFKKQGSFKLISLAKFKIKEIFLSIKDFILNTPEVVGKIFFAAKMSLLTYLCSSYFGVAGLVALLVYDNSETFVYIFLSGVMKTMSPIVTVLHKEKDYEAVQYVIRHSLKHVLAISLPISILFFVYPEILLQLFNVKTEYAKVVILAIRITAFSLLGRCLSYLMANYTQATEHNRISFIISFTEEFLFAFVGALILTEIIGGVGIWVSIIIAECIPVVIYLIYTFSLHKNFKNRTYRFFMLQNRKEIAWTYSREDIGKVDKYLDEKSREVLLEIEDVFKDNAVLISNSLLDICHDIFEKCKTIDNIDISIKTIDNEIYISLTTDGELYNQFSNENLMKSDNIEKLSKLNCKFDYDEILGFNKSYIIFKQ